VGDDFADPQQPRFVDLDRSGITRIDQKECLDLGVEELVELAIGILPAALGCGVDRHLDEPVIVQPRDLDMGSEDRQSDRDLVSGRKQSIFAQGMKEIGYSGGDTLHRKERSIPARGGSGPAISVCRKSRTISAVCGNIRTGSG
jgi:hypothetical protein